MLNHWVGHNDTYEYDGGGEPNCNYGLLEDYLNYVNLYKLPFKEKQVQTDLLMPIQRAYSISKLHGVSQQDILWLGVRL